MLYFRTYKPKFYAMKKNLLSLITLLGAGIIANAQITINQSHIVSAGDAVEQAVDTLGNTVTSIGPAGANQTWNFTSMTEHYVDTLFFENHTSYPGAGSISNANLGTRSSTEDSSWIFLNKGTTGLFVVGQSGYIASQFVTLNYAGPII